MPEVAICLIIFTLSGFIPGLIITKSEFKHFDEWENSIFILSLIKLEIDCFLFVLNKTSAPKCIAKLEAPCPQFLHLIRLLF